MSGEGDKATRLLDAAFHDAAVEVAESDEATDLELGKFGLRLETARARLDQHVRDSIASAKRARLAAARDQRTTRQTTSGIGRFAGWTREKIAEQIRALEQRLSNQVQVAHRDLESAPLEDLRSLLEDLEDAAEDDDR